MTKSTNLKYISNHSDHQTSFASSNTDHPTTKTTTAVPTILYTNFNQSTLNSSDKQSLAESVRQQRVDQLLILLTFVGLSMAFASLCATIILLHCQQLPRQHLLSFLLCSSGICYPFLGISAAWSYEMENAQTVGAAYQSIFFKHFTFYHLWARIPLPLLLHVFIQSASDLVLRTLLISRISNTKVNLVYSFLRSARGVGSLIGLGSLCWAKHIDIQLPANAFKKISSLFLPTRNNSGSNGESNKFNSSINETLSQGISQLLPISAIQSQHTAANSLQYRMNFMFWLLMLFGLSCLVAAYLLQLLPERSQKQIENEFNRITRLLNSRVPLSLYAPVRKRSFVNSIQQCEHGLEHRDNNEFIGRKYKGTSPVCKHGSHAYNDYHQHSHLYERLEGQFLLNGSEADISRSGDGSVGNSSSSNSKGLEVNLGNSTTTPLAHGAGFVGGGGVLEPIVRVERSCSSRSMSDLGKNQTPSSRKRGTPFRRLQRQSSIPEENEPPVFSGCDESADSFTSSSAELKNACGGVSSAFPQTQEASVEQMNSKMNSTFYSANDSEEFGNWIIRRFAGCSECKRKFIVGLDTRRRRLIQISRFMCQPKRELTDSTEIGSSRQLLESDSTDVDKSRLPDEEQTISQT